MDYELTQAQYGRVYGTTERTIRTYQGQDAPLDEPEAMFDWLHRRRTQPAAFRASSKEEIVTNYRRMVAEGSERAGILLADIKELLASVETDKCIIVCKLLVADGAGCRPTYYDAVRESMGQIRDAVEAARTAMGIGEEVAEGAEDDDEDDDEAAPAENIVHLPQLAPAAPSKTAAHL